MKRTPNSVDVHVGSRVRSRRLAVGLTQDKLARALGLTFQQIQKYEKGTNRIGAGRLQAISRILDTPVSFFFSDGPGGLVAKLSEARSAVAAQQSASPDEARQLIKSFLAIRDAETRRSLMRIAVALGTQPADHDP